MLSVHFNFIYCASLVIWAMVSIYRLKVLLAASALTVGPPGAIRLSLPHSVHATQPSGNSQPLPSMPAWTVWAEGWHSLHPGRARYAGRCWLQYRRCPGEKQPPVLALLIALPPGTAASHGHGIAPAARKGPFLPLILWQCLSQGQSLTQSPDLIFSKRPLCCAQLSSWAAL